MPIVLIVDDDDQIRHLLQQVIEDAGYEVLEARNGPGGLYQCRATSVDLLIADILYPGGDNLGSISLFRRDYPCIKIIAMTGAPGEHNFLELAQQQGADATLEKPFTVDQIMDLVQDLVPVLNT